MMSTFFRCFNLSSCVSKALTTLQEVNILYKMHAHLPAVHPMVLAHQLPCPGSCEGLDFV